MYCDTTVTLKRSLDDQHRDEEVKRSKYYDRATFDTDHTMPRKSVTARFLIRQAAGWPCTDHYTDFFFFINIF